MMEKEEKVFFIFCTFIFCTYMCDVKCESGHFSSSSSKICSSKCYCDDRIFKVVCRRANLTTIPLSLNARVKELYINENSITSLTSLSAYEQVEIASLSSNKLTTLSSDSINNLTHLQILFVDNNEITRIVAPFHHLNSLIVLNIANNKLQVLKSFSFLGLSQLQELDLSGNRITTIQENAFIGLNNLKVLSLRNNELNKVPSDSQLKAVASLIKLNVGLNNLKEVKLNQFNCLQHLEELYLDSSSIQSLIVTPVTNNSSTKLLPFNPLSPGESINPHHHHRHLYQSDEDNLPLKSLRILDISHNNFTEISLESNKLFRHILCINFQGNFVKCDCSLEWLRDFQLEMQRKYSSQFERMNRSTGNGAQYSSSVTIESSESNLPFDCPVSYLLSSVQCWNSARNERFDQLDLLCSESKYQFYLTFDKIEKSPVFIWFLLLCASSVATLIMIYVKYSIYKPIFPAFYALNRCNRYTADDVVPFLVNQSSSSTSSLSCASLASSSSSCSRSSFESSASVRDNQVESITSHPLIVADDEMNERKRSPVSSGCYVEHCNPQHPPHPPHPPQEEHPLLQVSPSHSSRLSDALDRTQMLVVSSKSTTKTTLLSHTQATDEMV